MTQKELKNKKKRLNLRKLRIRKKISGSLSCPRLSLFVSNKNYFAQAIDDTTGNTLVSMNSKVLKASDKITKSDLAYKLGEAMAAKLLEAKINHVVFDRNGKLFHGRVKAFVDALKEKGVKV